MHSRRVRSTFFTQRIIALAPFGGMRNDFQKEDCQSRGTRDFATPRPAGFPLDPLSENSHSVAAQGGEMTHWGARTRQMGTFPVNRENISPAQNAGLPESSGPLGVVPTCIVRLRAVGTLRCYVMHARRARSNTKSGFPKFSRFHPAPGQSAEQKKQSVTQKRVSRIFFPLQKAGSPAFPISPSRCSRWPFSLDTFALRIILPLG
jgi:hypothetical protein